MEEKWRYAVLFLYLLTAAVMDIRTKKVSLKLAALAEIAAAGMEFAWHLQGVPGMLAGMLPGIFLLAVGWITREAVGYGDGLVMLVCGSFLGFTGSLELLLLGLFLTCPVSLGLFVFRKAGRKTQLPFLPFLLLGYMIWLLT